MKHDYTNDEIRDAWKDSVSLCEFLDSLPERPQVAEIAKLKEGLAEAQQIAESWSRHIHPATHDSIVSTKDEEIAALKAALAESEKQFQDKVYEISSLLDECDKAQGILKACLSVMPFGNIETHTVENLPGRIADLASEIASLSLENERLEAEIAALPARPQAAEIAKLKSQIDHLEERDRQGRAELVQLRTELLEARKSADHWHSEAELLRAEEAKAQAELASLRQPIQSDVGISLGQVYQQAYNDAPDDCSVAEASEIALQTVAAVVTAQAIRRMEAVPWRELKHVNYEAVRARLIAAAKGEGQQPIKGLEGLTKERCLRIAEVEGDSTIAAGRPDVCPHAAPHVFCETCKASPCPIGIPAKGEGQAQEVPQVKPASDATRSSLIEHLNKPSTRIEITEIPDIPPGPVGTLAYAPQVMAKSIQGNKCPACGAEEVESNTPNTTYACGSSDYDGRPGTFHPGDKCEAHPIVVNELPQDDKQPDLSGESEKQAEPAQAQQDAAEARSACNNLDAKQRAELLSTAKAIIGKGKPAQPWTPAVGDTVRLKSGGPVMTVTSDNAGGNHTCTWFNSEDARITGWFPAACLTPAQP